MLGQEQIRRKPLDPNTPSHYYSHSRTRTTSSNIFPPQPPQPPQMQMQMQAPTPMHLQQPPFTSGGGHNRRSPSINTFSTTSSNNPPPPPAAFRTSPTADIRRSTSSRSGGGGGSGMSYVTLLRKQKATVWCDRAQYEDPRLLAQQRAAKQRANQEVFARASQGRTATGISSGAGKVAAKIRHHGKPGVVGYTPENNYIGVGGVPLRLSATEVEGEDSDDETTTNNNRSNEDHVSMQRLHHRRTGSSGRSSTTSGRRAASAAYRTSGGVVGPAPGSSGGGSGSGSNKRWSPGDTPERTGSLATQDNQAEFQPGGEDKLDRPQSVRSGSSAEKADALPELSKVSAAKLASNSLLNAALTREKSVKNPEDLRRRGSVDERTMTLSSGRLFIANPD